jgi:L-aspartate oxidase
VFDAIVVGGGASGLYTALCLSQTHLRVALLTKDNLAISASDWAQGGIAAVVDPTDSPLLHYEDTLRAGVGLCEPEAVSVLVHGARAQIDTLVALGVAFDRQGDQTLSLTLEAAHSRRRVLHAADATGRALVSTLADHVGRNGRIEVFEQFLVLDLIVESGQCTGVWGWDLRSPQANPCQLRAPVTVLATGGGAQVFAQNTNPPASTGDGVAIAWRAGAAIRDLEFVQFHPTSLAVAGAPRFLISEAVRGEGAHLVDGSGERFVLREHPQGELAPRDVVSRAVFRHLKRTGAETVFLDLSPIARDRLAYRFPNILQICQQWHIDPLAQPIPVTPAAHYCMGGIATDVWGATSVPGLYAVGECASTGVHGANRLASNSLLECFVFGSRLAAHLAEVPPQRQSQEVPLGKAPTMPTAGPEVSQTLTKRKQEMQELVWHHAGICRHGERLGYALGVLQQWRLELPAAPSRLWVETRNLMDFAYLLMRSAELRTESRGGHYREDFPETLAPWRGHTVVVGEQWSVVPLGDAHPQNSAA